MTDEEILATADACGLMLFGLGLDKAKFEFCILAFAKQIAKLDRHHEREALAQTQEPVAWRAPKWSNLHGEYGYRDFDDPVTDINGKPSPYNEPLYTHSQRTWVGLTDKEIDSYFEDHGWSPSKDYYPVIKAIEAKLKEKNT